MQKNRGKKSFDNPLLMILQRFLNILHVVNDGDGQKWCYEHLCEIETGQYSEMLFEM